MRFTMRLWAPILLGCVISGPAAAMPQDELSLAGLAQIDIGDVVAGAGSNSTSFALVPADNGGIALSAQSRVDGAITHSPIAVTGGMTTGSIGAFSSATGGGISNIQLSTGFNNLQQNSISVLMAVGS